MVKKQVNKRRVFIVILGVITAFAIYLVLRGDTIINDVSTQNAQNTITTEFSCSDGKSIKAEFVSGENSSVDLTLGDGTKLSLSQVVSSDGGRYANTDESIVFLNVGDTATLEEKNQIIYENCVASS